ncbi:MAG TPA: radical SAM protein [Thermomicrobiaceae bacterium]|nr:radical SAM protein [Thermomicrobiaceae bacterium]
MKIALIAMSGVRACNEELTRLGFTLPGFVERSKVIASLPSLSLLTLAGMTPETDEVAYYEVADIRDLDALPPCDLAAISTYSAQVKDAYALAERYRAVGVRTVIGGLHASVLPEEALRHCDAVVVGEGEVSWGAVLADARAGRLGGIYRPAGREFDLADAPTPRYDLLEPERYNRLTVQTQRGCPWHCEFCASSILLTPRYKVKPVARVIDEIHAIKAIWPHPFIEFADDNTFVDKRHGKELLRALAAEDVHWFTETDVSVAEDEELLDLMRDSGCAEVLIGFESPTAAGLEGVELKRNWKRRQLDSYRRAIERIQAHGIAVNGCFVLGLDGDDPGVFDAVADFVAESGLFDVQITVLTAFPGTPLYARLLAEGRILEDGAWEKCTLFDVNYVPRQMSARRLELGLMDLAQRLYSEEAKRARTRAFRHQVRRGRTALV